MFAGGYLLSGGSKKQAQQGPPINAGSKEEGDFIQYVYLHNSGSRWARYRWRRVEGSHERLANIRSGNS